MQNNQIPNKSSSPVTAEIIRITKKPSKFGGIFYDVIFRFEQSRNCYRGCIYEDCRNFVNWRGLLNVGNILKNLDLIPKYGKLIVDADSQPLLIRAGSQETKPFVKSKLDLTREKLKTGQWRLL